MDKHTANNEVADWLSDIIVQSTVVSKPGAELRVERVQVSDALRRGLTTNATSIGGIPSTAARDTPGTTDAEVVDTHRRLE
jgi:hypothetical protein